MNRLVNTLARLGATRLASFLGENTIRLLEVLDLKNLAPRVLAELVVKQLGPEGLLLNRRVRSELVGALRREDAEQLASLLQLSKSDNPWTSIERLNFSRGQAGTEVLFTFFGCPVSDQWQETETAAPTQVIEPGYPLFEHQRQAYIEVIAHLRHGPRPRVLLHMPTGAGKTRTAMNVVAHCLRDRLSIGEVVLWLAHAEELCDQAAEEFVNAWRAIGNRQVTVFRAYGPYRVDLDAVRNGVLIGGIQLLYLRSLSEQEAFLRLAARMPLLIMDEAHQAIAPTYEHVLNLITTDPNTAILGLSATPGRSWLDAGQDLRLAEFFNRTKVTLRVPGYANPVEFLQKEGYLAQAEYDRIESPSDIALTSQEQEELRTGFDLPDSLIARLSKDHMRNLLILNRIMREADAGGKIIVFACSVAHASLFANLLRVKGYGAASVTSKTPAATRRQLISQYRDTDDLKILTNYGVLAMGFDAPRTNVAIITRPTRSVVLYSQMVGRAARGPRAGGNERCRIITVVDRIPGFRSIAEAFTFWEDLWS